jgi:hypothetical protein
MTTKAEFEAFIVANCPMHVRQEPRIERDGDYRYECFDDAEGNEVAFISRVLSAEDRETDIDYVIKTGDA